MEQRFLFGLLMLGEGNLTPNYLFFCFLASLGVLQFVAGKYVRRELMLLPPRAAQSIGAVLLVAAFVWFFLAEPDIFIPGLAGGELLTFSIAAFVSALLVTRGLKIVLAYLPITRTEFSSSEPSGRE